MENTQITISKKDYDRLVRAERFLEDLTPGGSEFYQCPQNCYDFVKDWFDRAHERTVNLIRKNRLLEKQVNLPNKVKKHLDTLTDEEFLTEWKVIEDMKLGVEETYEHLK